MNTLDSARSVFKILMPMALTLLGTVFSLVGAAQERNYVLATATVGGTYYPVGVALSTLVKVKLRPTHKIDMDAITSAGSNENVRLLRDGEAQFAILSGLAGYQAWTGKASFEIMGPQTSLRAVTALWPEAEHYVIRRQYAKTGTIEDMQNLKEKKVSLGLENSGTLALSRLVLGKFGFELERDFELVYLGYDDSAEAIQKNRIEAMSTPAGTPVTAVMRAMTALGGGLVILQFTEDQLQTVNSGAELWARYVIEPGVYPTQNEAVETVATLSFLAVRADEDEDVVYEITKTIYENLTFLQTIHKALALMRPETALQGLPVPLHPGALRYYQEIKLSIPPRLTAGQPYSP